jgi:hypothetical protein
MIDDEISLSHNLFQVAIAERIAQVLPDAQNDDSILEMSSGEQRPRILGIRLP